MTPSVPGSPLTAGQLRQLRFLFYPDKIPHGADPWFKATLARFDLAIEFAELEAAAKGKGRRDFKCQKCLQWIMEGSSLVMRDSRGVPLHAGCGGVLYWPSDSDAPAPDAGGKREPCSECGFTGYDFKRCTTCGLLTTRAAHYLKQKIDDLPARAGEGDGEGFGASAKRGGSDAPIPGPSPTSPQPPAGTARRFRHKKRGTTYEIVGDAKLQTSAPAQDNWNCIVYRSLDDGKIWVRPVEEFFDGRFEEIDRGPSPTPPAPQEPAPPTPEEAEFNCQADTGCRWPNCDCVVTHVLRPSPAPQPTHELSAEAREYTKAHWQNAPAACELLDRMANALDEQGREIARLGRQIELERDEGNNIIRQYKRETAAAESLAASLKAGRDEFSERIFLLETQLADKQEGALERGVRAAFKHCGHQSNADVAAILASLAQKDNR